VGVQAQGLPAWADPLEAPGLLGLDAALSHGGGNPAHTFAVMTAAPPLPTRIVVKLLSSLPSGGSGSRPSVGGNPCVVRVWGGAPGRIRTCDPLLRRQPLCPLSYGRGPAHSTAPEHDPGIAPSFLDQIPAPSTSKGKTLRPMMAWGAPCGIIPLAYGGTVAVAQRQSTRLWLWGLGVRIPSATPANPEGRRGSFRWA
jgi:hypothetical protein